jgi:hypothetical protein
MQWYTLLVVMLVVLDGRVEWLAFSAAGYVAAEPQMGQFSVPHPAAVGYGLAVALVTVASLVRLVISRHVRSQSPYRVLTEAPAIVREEAPMTVN